MAENNRNTMGSAIAPGIIARLSQAAKYVVAGIAPEGFFGPNQPIAPMAQEKAVGRQFDYDTGYNLRQKPKQAEGADYQSLRALAENYDLLRLVIETRKDQIAAMSWAIKPKIKQQKNQVDKRIEKLTEFFACPDKEHTWDVWLRALVEDLLVIDAPAIYPRMTVGGELYALELMDGASIKRVIDDSGRTPLPPSPAYQQILKGLPAVDYTRETLIYAPRNVRTNRVYGFSPVEQVQMTVNIALRRQLSQMQYYTEGSTPDLIFGVPDEWQPDQIKQFQEWWDSVLSGNSQAKRGTRFVPGGMVPYNTKDQVLKDSYDEWLARIVCFAFSISPQAFSTHMNRATAETAADAAHSEGLLPLMKWVQSLINKVLLDFFKITDLEFSWVADSSVNALTQSQIDVAYVAAKIKDPNEVRDSLGLAAFTPEQIDRLHPPPKMPKQTDKDQGKYLGKVRALSIAKAKIVPALNRERQAIKVAQNQIVKAIKKWQATALKDMTAQALEQFNSRKGEFVFSSAEKADGSKNDSLKSVSQQALDQLRRQLDTQAGAAVLYGDMAVAISKIASDGATQALYQIGMDTAPEVTLNLVSAEATDWASARAAEMVGMRLVNGQLVDNPNARWVITEQQREDTAQMVVNALEGGWSNDKLASELSKAAAFDSDRAELIARTETAMADVQGNMAAYRNSSVVTGKQWILGAEACDDCVANSAVGSIGLMDLFPSGDDGPPAHPNCRCDILPTVVENMADNSAD